GQLRVVRRLRQPFRDRVRGLRDKGADAEAQRLVLPRGRRPQRGGVSDRRVDRRIPGRRGVPLEDRLRLRPTPEQYRAFGEYLCEAHSWYKHLPLEGGRRFVVFVAPDAGIGRLVAVMQPDGQGNTIGYTLVTPPEGPEFTEEHPRLHYGWQ